MAKLPCLEPSIKKNQFNLEFNMALTSLCDYDNESSFFSFWGHGFSVWARATKLFYCKLLFPIKFSFSEKATKIWKNLPLVLTLLSKNNCFVKTSGRSFQIFRPSHNVWTLNFSNFTLNICIQVGLWSISSIWYLIFSRSVVFPV